MAKLGNFAQQLRILATHVGNYANCLTGFLKAFLGITPKSNGMLTREGIEEVFSNLRNC